MIWSARVHKTGTSVQLLKNGSVTKVIKASADTFQPIEAKGFAENLVKTLNTKAAKQMTDPGAKPAIDTKAEEQEKANKMLSQDAKGISVKEASAIVDENRSLKKKVARLEKEAVVERKARRGLVIAKELVKQNKLANDESVIKDQVIKIVAMSNDEIGLLEKKVAGAPLYDSAEEAMVASRRYARMARLHKQAAEDAQLADNVDAADDEDAKAAKYDELSKEAASTADKFYAQIESAKADAGKPNDVAGQIEDEAKGVDAQGKKASSKTADDKDGDDDGEEEFIDDTDVDEDEDEDMEIEAAAAIYRKIASNHKTKAEELKKSGNEKDAAVELEIAKEADEMADSIDEDEDEDEEEDFGKEAAVIYRKIATDHRKRADELEACGKTDEADEEDEIADEADQLAASVETSLAKTADDDDKDKKDGDAMKVEMGTKSGENKDTAKAADATDADDGKKTCADADDAGSDDTATATDDAAVADDKRVADTDTTATDAGDDAAATDASDDEDDPLAALLSDDEKKAAGIDAEASEDDGDDGKMPTDEEIDAAVAGDSDEDEVADEDVAGEDREASKKSTKKIANEGYSKRVASSYDRIEQNPQASDPQVRELESLWRHDEE